MTCQCKHAIYAFNYDCNYPSKFTRDVSNCLASEHRNTHTHTHKLTHICLPEQLKQLIKFKPNSQPKNGAHFKCQLQLKLEDGNANALAGTEGEHKEKCSKSNRKLYAPPLSHSNSLSLSLCFCLCCLRVLAVAVALALFVTSDMIIKINANANTMMGASGLVFIFTPVYKHTERNLTVPARTQLNFR